MLKSLIRGKFIGSRSVNNHPEHFVNNQVLTVGIAPYAFRRVLPLNEARPNISGVPSTPVPGCARSTLSRQERAIALLQGKLQGQQHREHQNLALAEDLHLASSS